MGVRRQEKGEMVTDELRLRSLDALNGAKSEILDIFLAHLPCFAAVAWLPWGNLDFCANSAPNA